VLAAGGARGGSRPSRPGSRGDPSVNPSRGVGAPGGSRGGQRGRVPGRELNKEDRAVLEDADARTLSMARATAQRARRLAADAQQSSAGIATSVQPFWQLASEWNEVCIKPGKVMFEVDHVGGTWEDDSDYNREY
jgi:hypothetical protein